MTQVNDTKDELQRIKEYIYSCGTPKKIELLPYHAMGEHKYDAIGIERGVFFVPSEDEMNKFNRIFSVANRDVGMIERGEI